ncbi:MAG: ADP-forming succinate--CoA ligase subunit beta [Deltaproteobacteria bacterium]|nr:ADP-forming succinate--CoA ligase subunit beta [Deltaproteobacteria bacterium]
MKIHEYQAKQLFRKYGIPVPEGEVAFDVDRAVAIAGELIEKTGDETVVVKAQIHAGGRGKGGGVKVVKGVEGAREAASAILGMNLVTHQTGPEGKQVGRLLVEQGMAIARELYVGLVVDREQRRICLMASTEGGVEIEEVAAKTPEKILKVWFNPQTGLLPFQGRDIAFGLGLEGKQVGQAVKIMTGLAKMFVAEDTSLVEINPMVVTEGGAVVALDGKLNFDDNAKFRHKDHVELCDATEENPVEAEAAELGFSYVGMDGDIGCCVNGAGLAMATMDIIKHEGGEPANFLDVGGGADAETVKKAFKIILSDDRVKAIFVNIFGGILRCDVLAEGVVGAAKEMGIEVPLIVRLEGTNVDIGRKILAESGLKINTAKDMAEGAKLAVELARA